MTSAGIVLAGGRSTRMGRPKATLEWHGSTLVRRAAGLVARAVDGPVVVVRALGQALPALPPAFAVVADERDGRGPLQGMAGGLDALDALGARVDVAFVAGVDLPFLHPALVAHVLRSIRPGDDVALPHAHGFAHPLAAAYRVATVAPRLRAVLAGDRLGTGALLAGLRVRELDTTALLADTDVARLDPQLDSLTNVNTTAQYAAARARPAPRVTVDGRVTRAATVGQAAGDRPVGDPEEPLAEGDAVTFGGAGIMVRSGPLRPGS